MAKSFNNGKYLIHKNLDYKNFYEEEKNTIFLSRQNDGGTYIDSLGLRKIKNQTKKKFINLWKAVTITKPITFIKMIFISMNQIDIIFSFYQAIQLS